jgi:hypothetical protein
MRGEAIKASHRNCSIREIVESSMVLSSDLCGVSLVDEFYPDSKKPRRIGAVRVTRR